MSLGVSSIGTGALAGKATIGVLIVSPNPVLRDEMMARLRSSRWQLHQAVSGADAFHKIESESCEVVLMDSNLPDLDPTEFKALVHSQCPYIDVITLNQTGGYRSNPGSGSGGLGSQVVSMLGPGLALMAARAADDRPAPRPLQASDSLPGMVGDSPLMQRVYKTTRLVAKRDTTVLIAGETGTGKELIARAIHSLSARRANPFVVINCAAIPESLLEAELFGFAKGSFTGALQSRTGRIHAAHGGTLFLDEIGEVPVSVQSKLLRFLEQGEVQKIGTCEHVNVDVRVIAATNASLQTLVEKGEFRRDLYYRLSVFPISLPPLRDRIEDLPGLAEGFASQIGTCRTRLTPDAIASLQQHSWPGNVRELRNVIERAIILAGDAHDILPEHVIL